MTQQPQPKIVQATDEPIFDGPDTAKADTLDAVVANNSSNANSSTIVQPDYLERMKYLAKNVVGSFNKSRTIGGSFSNTSLVSEDSEAALFLASFICIKKKEDRIASVTIPEIKSILIKQFLTGVYGPEVAQSGIYETLNLDSSESVTSETLSHFFPEFKSLNNFKNKEVEIKDNPYQSILALPLEVRPFFSGILTETNPIINNDNSMCDFNISINTRQILDYAKRNNELQNVGKYLKILSEAGVNR